MRNRIPTSPSPQAAKLTASSSGGIISTCHYQLLTAASNGKATGVEFVYDRNIYGEAVDSTVQSAKARLLIVLSAGALGSRTLVSCGLFLQQPIIIFQLLYLSAVELV